MDVEKFIKKLIEAHVPTPSINDKNAFLEIGYNAGLMKAIEIAKEFGENKKATNFERIKSMDMEEFLNWLYQLDTNCDSCIYKRIDCYNDPKIKCIEGMRKYLESEGEKEEI